MTMKPEFSKPFNIEHAKAGAPYGCKDGQHAEILKWDCNHQSYPLIGAVCEHGTHYPESWTASGVQASDEEIERRPGRDLVMLPLGLIDGKPVFVGDDVIHKEDGHKTKALPTWGGMDPDLWAWPAPAREYPTITLDEVNKLIGWSGENWKVNFANAALRRAIDVGQVVTVEGRAERDMAIAEAAAEAVYNKVYAFGAPRRAYSDLGIDFAALIATIK